MRLIPLICAVSLSVHAADKGLPPRAQPSDYQAQQTVQNATYNATVAAAAVPARQIQKLFSADVAKYYVVVEVAVYPNTRREFEVDRFNFGLKQGDAVAHVEHPRDIVTPWPDKASVSDKPVTVTTTTGVMIGKSSDPVNGTRTVHGAYEGVSVTNDPRAADPPATPRQKIDPAVLAQRIEEKMLPEGPAQYAVAGYLFFPLIGKRRKGAMELQWTRDNASAVLKVGEK